MKTLPLDVARCNGATVDNEKYNAPLPTCMHCQRRLQIPKNTRVRYYLMSPPLFDKGVCDKSIYEDVAVG
jgi:hypothetical protein